MSILVTGAAGFIGARTTKTLLDAGHEVIGIDSLDEYYYDPKLKHDRLKHVIGEHPSFHFYQQDICDQDALKSIYDTHPSIEYVIHLAAQAGVRYSVDHPNAYTHSNLNGHMAILELCRHIPHFKHLIYASSSSIYGSRNKTPFCVSDDPMHPRSLYAATKVANEALTYSYSHLYNIAATGLRFFTVYGPWGRPDMATYLFTDALFKNETITIFNEGKMKRDFTYIQDVVSAIAACLNHIPQPNLDDQSAPYKVYNVGNNNATDLMEYLHILEQLSGKEAKIEFKPMHPGDMIETYANIDETKKDLGFEPKMDLKEGLNHFVQWYKDYEGVQ